MVSLWQGPKSAPFYVRNSYLLKIKHLYRESPSILLKKLIKIFISHKNMISLHWNSYVIQGNQIPSPYDQFW